MDLVDPQGPTRETLAWQERPAVFWQWQPVQSEACCNVPAHKEQSNNLSLALCSSPRSPATCAHLTLLSDSDLPCPVLVPSNVVLRACSSSPPIRADPALNTRVRTCKLHHQLFAATRLPHHAFPSTARPITLPTHPPPRLKSQAKVAAASSSCSQRDQVLPWVRLHVNLAFGTYLRSALLLTFVTQFPVPHCSQTSPSKIHRKHATCL